MTALRITASMFLLGTACGLLIAAVAMIGGCPCLRVAP